MEKRTSKQIVEGSVILEPTVWVGKNGVTEELVAHLGKQLEKRFIAKVKVQKTVVKSESTERIAKDLAAMTHSKLVSLRGRTFVLVSQKPIPKRVAARVFAKR